METVYATMITIIFGAWVWDLKSQVESLRHTAMASPEPPNPIPVNLPSRPALRRHHDAVRPPDAPSDATERGITRQNGVPTWVIS